MRFEDILHRLTGINCPIFGVSWNPSESECTHARKIIAELEAHRVLFSDTQFEWLDYCAESVLRIKKYLIQERSSMIADGIEDTSNVYSYAAAMLKACNRFLDRCDHNRFIRHTLKERANSNNPYYFSSLFLASALGELRNATGLMVGQMAKAYGLSVDDELASIIPD